MRYAIGLMLVLFAHSSWAMIDTRNANFTDTFTHIAVPGSGFDLKVDATYNSRTLHNGIVGFGWCTDFETNLVVTAEGFPRVTECGAGIEVTFQPKDANPKAMPNTINTILEEVKKRNKAASPVYLANLRKDLELNSDLRDEFARQLNMKGQVRDNVEYFSQNRENEKVVLKNGVFTRTMPDGTLQRFNLQGKLTQLYDRNGNYLQISYTKDKVESVVDNNGKKLSFKWKDGKVEQILGPNGLSVTYVHRGEDLKKATRVYMDGGKQKTETLDFDYDDLHNMTKIAFPDKTSKQLTYNKDKDWVTSFKGRDDCLESYTYEENKSDPLNNYWTIVTKKCGAKTTNQSRYEFWHKERPDGSGRFLYRTLTNNNGAVTDVIYHEVFGKAVSVVKNNIKTSFEFYPTGLVRTRFDQNLTTHFVYEKVCDKVAEVTSEYFVPKSEASKDPKKKSSVKYQLVKTLKTNFAWDQKKCNLVGAKNSIGQSIRLAYDGRGRISSIEDQAKKIVEIKYEERFGKPAVINRPGLGTLNVSYKSNGEVDQVDSKDGPTVALQVAAIFNNLLEIISPATSELSL